MGLLAGVATVEISQDIVVGEEEINYSAIRAQGAGGQNVNKVSSAIHLRFDIMASSLPQWLKERILGSGDQRITKDGVFVIKAQVFRSQERNRQAARLRLQEFLRTVSVVPVTRRATRPSRAQRQRRLTDKRVRAERKLARRSPNQAD